MRLGAEAALVLLAAALYLYDALLLLRPDEAVLVQRGRGRWRAGFGAQSWRLGGKEPWLPNPFTPHRRLRRLQWSFTAESAAAPARPFELPAVIARFAPFTWVSALCIFGALPLALFVPLGTAVTVGVVALLYLNILVALGGVWMRRQALQLSGKQVAALAFECLVCAPLSINLVRKLCARVAVDEPYTVAARRLLDAEALSASDAQCRARLEEQLAWEPEDSPRARALQAACARFAAPAAEG